ncbi:MAG: hypothetical protein IJT72_09210 [Lachnospiraceae bacterium]|nr:hypothetical protein [Lachnospiraceae bacterium]
MFFDKKICSFAAGVLFGTAGIRILSSRDAKKVYTHATAATLRAKDSVMKTVNTVKENCEDIYAEAKLINAKREEKVAEEIIEDTSVETEMQTVATAEA